MKIKKFFSNKWMEFTGSSFFMAGIKKVFSALLILSFCAAVCAEEKKQVKNLVPELSSRGITLYWDSLSQSGTLEKNGHMISFHSGDDFTVRDSKFIVPGSAPVFENGILSAAVSFINEASSYFQNQSAENSYRIGAILIDAGHGGKDNGASATHKKNGKNVTVIEKNVNLAVALKLNEYLKKAYPDKKIIMTRSKDKYLTLAERTEIANGVKLKDNEAIIFISIHVNASLNKKASGYEVWYLSQDYRRQLFDSKNSEEDKSLAPILNSMLEEEFTTESILMAQNILEGMKAQIGDKSISRGLKEEEWYVVRNSNMPSVLIETGFLTNPEEGLLLSDDFYLQKLAFGIYNGIQSFVTYFERSRGFTGK